MRWRGIFRHFASRRALKPFLFLTFFFSLPIHSAAQAEGTVRHGPFFFDRTDPSTIFLAGEIDTRSGLNFMRILDASGEARNIVLASDGGLVHVGLSIAMEIRRRELSTFVPAGLGCYSACSFLWFAGVYRYAGGEIGVHQLASKSADLAAGQLAISDIVEVLTGFGVPSEVIVRMLQTPSSEMHILSLNDLERFKLIGDARAGGSSVAPQAFQQDTGNAEQRAISFVAEYNRDWSRANSEALLSTGAAYSGQVGFYGNTRSRAQVMEEKQAFVDRWPVRYYYLDVSTARAVCSPSRCTVTGEVVWDARSPERSAVSRGRSFVEITLARDGNGFFIVGEAGRVLERY